MQQDISKFVLPKNFRGKNAFVVQIWWLCQASLFRFSPRMFNGFRGMLLRFFGAEIGKNCIIRPTVRITYPWKLKMGDNCWIGDNVCLYTLGNIAVGSNTVISQGAHLCAADHDARSMSFQIRDRPIIIGDSCWIAADCFVAPGATVEDGSVISARSTVFGLMPAWKICAGSPCRPLKDRVIDRP